MPSSVVAVVSFIALVAALLFSSGPASAGPKDYFVGLDFGLHANTALLTDDEIKTYLETRGRALPEFDQSCVSVCVGWIWGQLSR